MASLDNPLKYKLEHLFGMASGYVLDFTNATFADFVQTSIGFDPYENYQGSKASILRQLWQNHSNAEVRKLTLELLDRWRTNKLVNSEAVSESEQRIFDEAYAAVNGLAVVSADAAGLQFLEKDFNVDVSKLRVPLSFRQVVEQRLDEIEKCMEAESPLAVIFLGGSTLEGLLNEVALKNTEAFNRCKAAPRDRAGKPKPLAEWSLENLITTSRELGVIGEDVVKHAHAVKDFRNYIHPRQQIKENFTPRMFTAEIARHVLFAAIADLSRGGSGSS